MKDTTLTEIMFRSLTKDPKLASFEEWVKAADYATEIRFFPHAFSCLQLAAELKKDQDVYQKLDNLLDKITNVLEFVPSRLKPELEDIRLSNPLDPAKWLGLTNKLLKEDPNDIETSIFALAFTAYATARSGGDVVAINEVLEPYLTEIDDETLDKWQSPVIDLSVFAEKQIKVVALGDNVTLGLQDNFEINFQETYHYLWSKNASREISLANNAVSGAGALDFILYLGRDVIYYKPDIVFISFGINDVWLGPSLIPAYEAMLESGIRILHKHRIACVLLSPVPHIPENCPVELRPTHLPMDNLDVAPWAKACKRVAMRMKVPFADAFARFPKEKNVLEKLLANQFNQPNLAGHMTIEAALNEVIN